MKEDSAEIVVAFKDLEKKYFGNTVFQDLDLELKSGNFYALLGKNGSGKSTLMRIMAHREIATSGVGLVLGVGLDSDFCHIANDIGYVSEASFVIPGTPIREAIEFHAKHFKNWDHEMVKKLAAGFRLDLNKHSGELSRGQLVQLSLILNLSYSPRLILLDEVTAVLDASVRNFLMEVLAERVKKGATVILATNIVTEVQNFATSLILIGEKKIKVNSAVESISYEFIKLVRSQNIDHSIFSVDSCIEVGLSIRNQPIYLVAKKDALSLNLPKEICSDEPITPIEVFIYLTRLRD